MGTEFCVFTAMLPYKRFLLCVTGFFSVLRCLAQDGLPVAYLGIEQGLSNNAVTSIYKDRSGFMWFGTYDGLNRYDGYGFRIFRNVIGDSTSLGDNHVNAITGDAARRLWIACDKSVNVFNPATARFSTPLFKPAGSFARQSLASGAKAVEVYNDGQAVLVGSIGKGLLAFSTGNALGEQIPLEGGRTAYSVTAIAFDAKRNAAWVFAADNGLYLYDRQKKALKLINASVKKADCLKADLAGNVWLGNDAGLFRYDVATNSFSPNVLPSPYKVVNLFEDGQHRLWIGSDGGGVWYLSNALAKPQSYKPGTTAAGINSNAVYAVYEDEDGKWIGTLRGGINRVLPRASRFRCITYDRPGQNNTVNNFILSFCEDAQRNVWIGTDGAGLRYWNRQHNSFTQYIRNTANNTSIGSNFITGMCYDAQGDLWLATWFGGISRLKKGSQKFERFACVNPSTGAAENNAWIVYEDARKRLWVSTTNEGTLYLFNRKASRFEALDASLRNVQSLAEDRSGTLWAGTYTSLLRIDTAQKKHILYPIGQTVRCLHEDKSGRFWVGTDGGGLLLFNRKSGSYQRFTTTDGLPSNTVLRMLEDAKGNLWLSTYNGLCRFTPDTKSFRAYGPSDGLQSNQFSFNAALALRSGEFLFGGIKGFNVFHPDSLTDAAVKPPVFLTGIKVANEPIEAAEKFVTARSAERPEAIRLPYNQAALSLDFVAIDYTAADKLKYAYQLKGWDKGWTSVDNLRTANYSRLEEGRYTFLLKVRNAAGEWEKEKALLTVVVLPPPYRTWWAYAFYVLLIGLVLYAYLRYKTRQTQLTYQVKLAHMETEKEKELAEKKLSFFTDISHEFRTPLTLIINPLRDFLQNRKEKSESGELNVVYRNARRLLSLVDQLLLFQKAGTEGDRLNVSRINFYHLSKDVFESFAGLAKTKKIACRFFCDNEYSILYGDREKLEIVLYNLLSNALKFTPEGGRIVFEVKGHEATVDVSVSDSGPGIPPEIGERLFERFYRVSKSQSPSKPGFGIGLYLVKHFVQKHSGQISYQSTPGQGTTFHLQLPTNAARFSDAILTDEPGVGKTELVNELMAVEEEAPAEEEQPALDEIISDQKTLLVVEDNKEVRDYVAGIFKAGYRVYEAGSGSEGLTLAERYLPDLVISDVMMENGNGIELCNRIKEAPALSHIPVVLLTAVASDEVKLRGLECGADDYITKPFQKEILEARVAGILKNRSQLQTYFYNEITLKKHDLKISAEYKEFLERCIAVVEKHLQDDDFNIKKLAREIGMSHSALYRKVKSISGQSVSAFVRFIRLRKAAGLMLQGDYNVNEASFQVGIADTKYFRKQFNALFGMNPSDYIKKYRPAFSNDLTLNEKLMKPKN